MQDAGSRLDNVTDVGRGTVEGTDGTTVYYDGSCPLCSAEIRHYAAQDVEDGLAFVDVSRAEADLGSDLDPEAAMRRFHARLPDGSLVSGARAFIAVWDRLPGWHRVARIARIPPILAIVEGAYRLSLPLRPALSRLGAKPATRNEAGSQS